MRPAAGPTVESSAAIGFKALVTSTERERWYHHPRSGDRYESVTFINDRSSGKQHFIAPWSASTAAAYAVDHYLDVGELLLAEGRDAAVIHVAGEAQRLRELKAEVGSFVHHLAESLVRWAARYDDTGGDVQLPELPDRIRGELYDDDPVEYVADRMIDGFLNFVSRYNPVFEYAELVGFHHGLDVAGTLDAIIILVGWDIRPDGLLFEAPGCTLRVCLDTKTGRIVDVTTPEQLAVYRRMDEVWVHPGRPKVMPSTDIAAVLHLRPEHHEGYQLIAIPPAEDEAAWHRFCGNVRSYRERAALPAKIGRVAPRPRDDGGPAVPYLSDLVQQGYRQVPSTLRKLGFEDLSDVAIFTADELYAMRGIGKKSVETIRRMLADYGLALAGEPAPVVQGVA